MKYNKLFFACALSCLGHQAWAQPVTGKLSKDKMLEIGDTRNGMQDTYNALDWYTKAYNADNSNLVAVFKVAYTHDQLRDYVNAATWYQKLVEADKAKEYPLARYWYARTLMLNGKYKQAKVEFNGFKKEYADSAEKAAYYKEMADINIKGADFAIANPDPFEEVLDENLGKNVNSASTEGGAFAIGRNEIIYSSLRSDTLIVIEEGNENDHLAKIYTAKRSEDKEWEPATVFNADLLEKEGYHVIQPAFSADKSKFYFVRAQLSGNMVQNSQILFSSVIDGKLAKPSLLDFNSSQYSCKNPMVAEMNGKEFLLFSSNMEGTKGGYDIWYAEINEDGSTKQPLNLTAVNTIGDDVTPFFDERDNTLYFSSNGHPGVGGLDVFKTQRNPETGEYTSVENMGFGFNSRVDDFHFTINKEGNDDCYGYVVSNRPGTISLKSETCCDDIWSVIMPERCDIVAQVNIFDQETGAPLSGATVQLIDKATGKVIDEQKNVPGNTVTFLCEVGKEYEVKATKEGNEAGASSINTRKEVLTAAGFDLTKPIDLKKEVKLKELGLVVQTFNKKDKTPLSGVTVVVSDATTGQVVKELPAGGSNEFKFALSRNKSYKIMASREGYLADSRIVSAAELKNVQKFFLTPPPVFYNVYFDFDKSSLNQGAQDTLDMVFSTMKDNPNMQVEVLGHTDALGADNYNQILSEKRSNIATKYLINKGITADRLVSKGLGESVPSSNNLKEDGSDNPEGRSKNRRVEFKIVKNEAPTEKKN